MQLCTSLGSAAAMLEREFFLDHPRGLEISKWLCQLHLEYRALEAAKSQAYLDMTEVGIAMPTSSKFSGMNQLLDLVPEIFPYVVKLDTHSGLGPQTTIVRTVQDLDLVFDRMQFFKTFTGLIQTYCTGQEYTVTVLVGQHNWQELGTAKDYKRQFDGDLGINTSGMGSIAPAPNRHLGHTAIIDQVVQVLRTRCDYRGPLSCQFLFDQCNLWLLEYNTRFCDPEFQSMLMRLNQSLVTALAQCKDNEFIDPVPQLSVNAVTVGLMHRLWPDPQSHRCDITLDSSNFVISRMKGGWDYNNYWGSVTNAGTKSYRELAQEIYQFLSKQTLGPYRYRMDIGQ